MAKFYSIVFAVLLITSQQLGTNAFLPAALGLASSISGFVQFAIDYYEKVNTLPVGSDGSMNALNQMNTEAIANLEDIMAILDDLPNMLHHIDVKLDLNRHIRSIGDILENVMRKLDDIKNGSPDDDIELRISAKDYQKKIDQDLEAIQRLLIQDDLVNFLGQDYTTSVEKFEPVCKTGISYMQMLDKLLATLRFVTAQYYTAKNKIFDIFEYIDRNKPRKYSYNTTRENLFRKIRRDYRFAVMKFKKLMNKSSREIYTCDSHTYKDVMPHYNNFSENFPFYRLMAFQKYFVNEDAFNDRSEGKCSQITSLSSCSGIDTEKLCKNTRTCKGRLIGCHQFQKRGATSYLCLDKSMSMARYTSMVRDDENKLYCPDHTNIVSMNTPSHYPPMYYKTSLPGYFSEFCECICEESSYYISLQNVMASENKVITGAKFVISTSPQLIIQIQIQEAELLPDGNINNKTINWKETPKAQYHELVKIDWEGLKEIDLTEKIVPDDQVLVGLGFAKSQNPNRIHLKLLAKSVDIKLGTLGNEIKTHVPDKSGERELDLSDCDIPDKSGRPSVVNSENDQFLKFSLTSLIKDGGQSTIPFIDKQEVTSNRPTPLSGAGLIHKGQPGFGGFLALKLFTFNVVPYINDDIDLKEKYEIISSCS